MRPYLWQSAALYLFSGLLLVFHPSDFNLESVLNPLTYGRGQQVAYGVAFLVAALVAAIAGALQRPLWHLAALAAVAGVGTAWTLITLVGAIFYGGDYGRPLLWAYVAVLAYESMRFARYTPADEEAVATLAAQYWQAREEHHHHHPR